jgi:hypothetical protein
MNLENVESMLADMLYSQNTTVSVKGHSTVKIKTFLGRVTVPKVPFVTQISFPSMGRILASQSLEFDSIQVLSSKNDALQLYATITINNPTEITSILGELHLNCLNEQSGAKMGSVSIKNARIDPGTTKLKCMVSLDKSDELEELVGNVLSGRNQELILQGVQGSEAVHPILKNVIGDFSMCVKTNSSNYNLSFVSSVIVKRSGFNLMPEAFMKVSNPFPIAIKIISVTNLHVYAYKSDGKCVLITKMAQVPLEKPLIIPPTVENWVDEENPFPLQMTGNVLRSLKALEMLFNMDNPKDENGHRYLPTRIEGKITSEMDSMRLSFTFIKDRLPLYLEIGF